MKKSRESLNKHKDAKETQSILKNINYVKKSYEGLNSGGLILLFFVLVACFAVMFGLAGAATQKASNNNQITNTL